MYKQKTNILIFQSPANCLVLIWNGAYFEKSLPTVSEWQHSVWKTNEHPRQIIAPKKNAPKTIFSCICISIDGRVKKYVATPMNATQPSKWVHMLPVSVWIRNTDLKQARNEGNGGRWFECRKLLSCSHLGKWRKWHTFHEASHTWIWKTELHYLSRYVPT